MNIFIYYEYIHTEYMPAYTHFKRYSFISKLPTMKNGTQITCSLKLPKYLTCGSCSCL